MLLLNLNHVSSLVRRIVDADTPAAWVCRATPVFAWNPPTEKISKDIERRENAMRTGRLSSLQSPSGINLKEKQCSQQARSERRYKNTPSNISRRKYASLVSTVSSGQRSDRFPNISSEMERSA